MRGSWGWCAVVFLIGCGGSSQLEIDVRTDLVPIDEMSDVRVTITRTDGEGEPMVLEHRVDEGDDYVTGVRVASLPEVEHGDLRIDVEALDAFGRVVLERPTLITLDNAQGVTVVLTRDCRGVECGDAGAPLACLSGTCVNPRCTPENPGECDAMACAADADCAFAGDCAAGVCSDGVCLARPDDSLCGDDALWCNPEEGCVELPPMCPQLEVVEIDESTIDGGATWPAAEYVLNRSVNITGGPLVVEACSVVRLGAGMSIDLRDGGALTMEGADRMPIRVTSDFATPGRGDWSRVNVESTSASSANVWSNVRIEHGGSSSAMVRVADGASIDVRGSVLRSSGAAAMEVLGADGLRAFEDNVVTDNAFGVQIAPGAAGSLGPGTYGPNDVEGIRVNNGAIEADGTWGAWGVPYVVLGDLALTGPAGGSARVTVEAGAEVRMASGARVQVQDSAGLALEGTAEAPVTWTSASPSPVAGDWNAIFYRTGSIAAANRIVHAVVEHGGSSGAFAMVEIDGGAAVTIEDSTLRASATEGLRVLDGGGLDSFERNTILDNQSFAVELRPSAAGALGAGTYGPNDVEGVRVVGGTTEGDATWDLVGVPYVLSGTTFVSGAGSAVLTVGAGAELRFESGAEMRVQDNGALELLGESGAEILVTSSRASPSPGDWDQIRFFGSAIGARNLLRFARIEYGGGSAFGQVEVGAGGALTIQSVVFANAGMGCDVDLATTATLTDDGSSTFITCP